MYLPYIHIYTYIYIHIYTPMPRTILVLLSRMNAYKSSVFAPRCSSRNSMLIDGLVLCHCSVLPFFLSWVAKTQLNHRAKRVVSTRLAA